MYDFALENGSKVSTMLAVAAAAIVLTAVFYYRAFGTLKRYQWQLLLVLRIVAILIVVLLLFRPVLSYEETTTEKPAIVFLVDTSASMSITDDASGLPRFQLARAKVEQWWDKLKADFRLKVLEFSERAVPLERVEQLATLRRTANRLRFSTPSLPGPRRKRASRPSSCSPTGSTIRPKIPWMPSRNCTAPWSTRSASARACEPTSRFATCK